MHPAPSLVVFTVLSGLGLGMIAWIGLGLGSESPLFGWIGGFIALAVTGLGGIASVGHLGQPKNAWRAFSQWRSSWLSREACLMVTAKVALAIYLGLWLIFDLRIQPLGWVAAALAGATIYATSMIYAQLRTVPSWSATPTPHLFIAMAMSGGLLAVSAIMGMVGLEMPILFILVWLVGAAGTAIWWQTQAAGAPRGFHGSSMETATGLSGLGRVSLLEPPHTGSNYLLKEMAFEVGRARAYQLRKLGAVLGFLVPIALALGAWALVSTGAAGLVLALAVICHVAGVMALRWLFFAEAQHVQALYYGQR
ncbi:MAG: DmsC/YnfH family molybdoenzyme membrane anchor subunit [Pseudomonadota bacterium]